MKTKEEDIALKLITYYSQDTRNGEEKYVMMEGGKEIFKLREQLSKAVSFALHIENTLGSVLSLEASELYYNGDRSIHQGFKQFLEDVGK